MSKSVKFSDSIEMGKEIAGANTKSTKLAKKASVSFDEEEEKDDEEDQLDTSATDEVSSMQARRSAQDRAGVKFPINKLAKFAKSGKFAERIGQGTPVYMAGVLEYLAFEILELASNKAAEDKMKTIMPRHLMLAIRSDVEFNRFLKGADFKETGRQPVIFAEKSNKKKKGQMEESDSDEDIEYED